MQDNMGFLKPGERYELDVTAGKVVCVALSFQQQREQMRLIKQMATNNDPEVAMNLVEKVIATSVVSWIDSDEVHVTTDVVKSLMNEIGFAEATDLARRITESGKLSETERKK